MKRLIMLCLAAVAMVPTAVCLSGCAGLGIGAVVERAEVPAIVAAEGVVAARINGTIDALATAPAGSIDAAELGKIAANAERSWNRLAIARLAYDATLGADATAAELERVATARAETDAAFETLDGWLTALGRPAPD